MSTETNETTSSKKMAKISMSKQFPIKVLCDFISPYKGERETLTAFLTNCQNALDFASPSQTVLLIKYILSRLEGLHPRLSNNVRCRSPKSLNDAINVALEEEKIQNLLYKTTIKPKCSICGKPGHSESECRERRKRTGPPHVPLVPRPSTSFNNSQLFCQNRITSQHTPKRAPVSLSRFPIPSRHTPLRGPVSSSPKLIASQHTLLRASESLSHKIIPSQPASKEAPESLSHKIIPSQPASKEAPESLSRKIIPSQPASKEASESLSRKTTSSQPASEEVPVSLSQNSVSSRKPLYQTANQNTILTQRASNSAPVSSRATLHSDKESALPYHPKAKIEIPVYEISSYSNKVLLPHVYIATSLSTQPLCLLIDTGASISLVKLSSLTNVPELSREIAKIKGFNNTNTHSETLGTRQLHFNLNNNRREYKFHLVDDNINLEYDGIIGSDFLNHFKANIDYTSQSINICGQILGINYIQPTYVIPARSEAVIECAVSNYSREHYKNNEGLLLDHSISEGVYITNCLVHIKPNKRIIVTFLNTTTSDKQVRDFKVQLTPLESNITTKSNESVNSLYYSQTDRPQMVLNLIRCSHLNSEEKEALLECCAEYIDIFHLEVVRKPSKIFNPPRRNPKPITIPTLNHYPIKQEICSPGLYFDKLLDIKFTNSDWNVIAYVDISHVQPNLDKVEFLFEKLNVFCNSLTSSKIQTDCINSLSALKNRHILNVSKLSSISYLLIDENPNRRFKRGLMDLGGSLLKTIFGTLDSEDAVRFSNAIEEVQIDEKRLAHLMKDNIHVIKSTISYFNNTISKVNENENHIIRNMETIHKILETVTNSNDKLEIRSELSSLLHSLESIIMTLSFDIEDINNAILFAKLNILHPTVLSPHQLCNELDKHRNSLPSHFELPIPLTLQNIHSLIDISQLACFYHLNKIIIVVKIPLTLPQTYDLYRTIPLPVPYDMSKPDTYILIEPTSSYVTITADRMFYSLIADIDKCKVISDKCYVCVLTYVFSVIANPTCETTLLSDVINKLPDMCVTKLIYSSIDLFHKLTLNRWIFVQSEPGKCHVTCNDKDINSDVILFGTGILTLPKNCKAFYKTLQFAAVGETIISNITNKISNFNILQDDCCERSKLNKTLQRLPYSKLNNLDNLDSLLQASIHLNSFEEEISKIENPSHFQTYSTHYLSISLCISMLTLIYIMYKSRKYFCSTKSPCCIQIFNQCHNTKNNSVSASQNMAFRNNTVENSDESDSIEDLQRQRATPTPIKRNILFGKTHDS
ncbi:hypothetical protein HF086_005785 [Spodoptera exigua]|uniref:CCHC-type domain-containing protein n=1 Tax=Spodoptera exigua TaxID=7107 RepID=A0A922M1W4_SPOEX|nr:hypothetical protein HF086_005785 [Spodoptera exigua]